MKHVLMILLASAMAACGHVQYAFTHFVGTPGSVDGAGTVARFDSPIGVAVDSSDNVYVADTDNSTIRKITPAGAVTTLAGSAGVIGRADGIGSAAGFDYPKGVAVDSAGNLYVADTGNNRITKGTPLLLRFQTSTGSLTISNGLIHMQLSGPLGSNVVVESSANLQAWTPVHTNALPPDGLDVSLSLGAKQNRFFRARLAP